jgi:LysM repeat protein
LAPIILHMRKAKTMKWMTLALLLTTLTLVGCDNNKKTSPSKTNSGAVPAPAAESAPPPSASTPPPAPASSTPPPTPTAEAAPGPGPDTVAAPPAGTGKVYVVKQGDSLFKIARAHKTHVKDILAVNPDIKNPNDIKVGEKINLP